jgi:hypothetical protein
MAESAAEAPNVVIGTFMVNTHPATVLFNTGATHSFITRSFVEHHGIHISTLKRCMLVSSPGGQLRSHIFCPRVSVAIRGVEFSANLMVLDTKGIDVILGMETLARWGVTGLIVLRGLSTYQHRMDRKSQSVLWNPLGFFVRWRLDPRMVFAWCLNSRMSFLMICQVCHLITTLSFLLISCLAQLLLLSGPIICTHRV